MTSRPLDPYISVGGVFHDPNSPSDNAYHEPPVMRDFAAAIRSEAATYIHTQGTPSATWSINHNLNKFPAIDVVDSGGSVVIPDVLYNDMNTATITFGSATSGRAFCN